MLVGIARTSTTEQVYGMDAQLRDLRQAGCDKIFSEQVSSVAHREQLEAALDFVREGDTLVVTRLDRLCRSVSDLVSITRRLRDKGVELRILSINLDTSTPTGKLMLNLLGSIAEFERELMLERQREGIERAKAAGRYRGRAPTVRRQLPKIRELASEGLKPAEIARHLGCSRASVYRLLAETA